ncbi:hypothetical protein V500_10361 [Pseudogymnoascus sp. VKM F-4518 (FW-2643)]|nr:hypothetical protein V500_10361 [Pseudogymnoascus sp. VKM F-4518 (FW-2643)]
MALNERDTNESGNVSILLELMPQQHGIRHPEDDWTGLSNPVERRKLQNRIHQRAYRERKANKIPLELKDSPTSFKLAPKGENWRTSDKGATDTKSNGKGGGDAIPEGEESQLWHLLDCAAGTPKFSVAKIGRISSVLSPTFTQTQNLVGHFEKWASSQVKISPSTDHLLVLVRFNVFMAMMRNSMALGLSSKETMKDETLSPFCSPNLKHVPALPPLLRPTELQCRIPHHPWIDQLPFPTMRNNLLRAGDSFDDTMLCGDLIGFFSAGTGKTAMIVWGEPWDPAAWEVTEEYLEHWSWTLKGCIEILESTNRWRLRRGEKPLHI